LQIPAAVLAEGVDPGEVLAQLVREAGLEPRLTAALAYVASGEQLSPATYMRFAGVTPAVASRDLRSAVQAALLRPAGAAGERVYGAGAALERALSPAPTASS
jgi:hypothetical protein